MPSKNGNQHSNDMKCTYGTGWQDEIAVQHKSKDIRSGGEVRTSDIKAESYLEANLPPFLTQGVFFIVSEGYLQELVIKCVFKFEIHAC